MNDTTSTPAPASTLAPAAVLAPAPAPPPATAPASTSPAFDKLLKKILDAVEDLTTLNVVTAVGDVTITDITTTVAGAPAQSHSEKCENTKAIITRIDLVDGDIQTFMDTVFASENTAYNKIRDDHILRIQEAHDIIGNNVKVLKELVDTISAILATSPASKTKTVNLKAQ